MAKLAIVTRKESAADREVPITHRQYDRIQPGTYRGYCRAAEIYLDSEWRRWVCATQWDVVDEGLNKIASVTKFFNLGDRAKPKATSRRSHYWQAWTAAARRLPSPNSAMSPNIFLRRYAKVEVADVTKNFAQRAHSREEVYSIVRKILEWETGETA